MGIKESFVAYVMPYSRIGYTTT